jgi:hypothetical protein
MNPLQRVEKFTKGFSTSGCPTVNGYVCVGVQERFLRAGLRF